MMAFICCSAVSGFVLKVSIEHGELAPFVIPGASAAIMRTVRAPVRARVRARWAAVLAISTSAMFGATARADDPRFEASSFVGYGALGDTGLGNSFAPDQVPGSSAVLGARLGWHAIPELLRTGPLRLSLLLEGEVTMATASTSSSTDVQARMSFFAPVFGWRTHALVRQAFGARGAFALHAVLGVGGATVASSSPFMSKETDPLAYAGVGASLAISGRWQLRVDGRQGVMPGRTSDMTRVTELHFGFGATFGLEKRLPPPPPPPEPPPPPPAPDDSDADADGLPDRLEICPTEPETVNGLDDKDGCPEPDSDSDGVIGEADLCPLEAEDNDRFKDEDGCPDRDNDKDSLEDARDLCPNDPETFNGHDDTDGCPDAVPEGTNRVFTAAAEGVRFESRRARVTSATKKALAPILTMLETDRNLALAIVGQPERAGEEDLARRRADAVKWYLVDLGIAEDRLETSVGPVGGKGAPPILLKRR
jgi:outer membrane protein OmpA-like peptidoglycan-associated protein